MKETSRTRQHTMARSMRRVCRSGQTRCSPRSRKQGANLKLERASGWRQRTPTPNDAEHGRSSGKQEPSPHCHTFLRFSNDNMMFAIAVYSASDMNRLLVQIKCAFTTSLHSRHGVTCSVCLECISNSPSSLCQNAAFTSTVAQIKFLAAETFHCVHGNRLSNELRKRD